MTVTELEKLRKKAVRKTVIPLAACPVLAAAGLLLIVISDKPALLPLVVIVGLLLPLIAAMLIGRKDRKGFSVAFKETFVKKSLESVFDNLIYMPEIGIPRSAVADTGLISMGDNYTSNDYVSGTYKGIHTEFSDIHITEQRTTTDSKGNTTTETVTIFLGRWMIFDFNKNFKSNVLIQPKWLIDISSFNPYKNEGVQPVEMEDVEFNKHFKVYAQNDAEAFYILTPSLMDRIKTLRKNLKNGSLYFCFRDSKLNVAYNSNKDAFEHSILKKIDEQKVIEEITADIRQITDFVDGLNLDNDLFKKGGTY